MKKKPIYLWVLLILSALISAMSLFGMLSPLPSKEALRAAQKQVAGVSAQQLEDQLNYNYGVAEAYHSIFNMALIVLSAIFSGRSELSSLFVRICNMQTILTLAMFC